MACCKPEIHVGDIGTVYHVEITDSCQPFDPSDADIAELIFLMPNGIVLRKTATVTTEGSPADAWFLDYEVTPGSGLGSPGEFHDNPGPLQVQAYLHFADGTQWHSSVQTVDTDDNQLYIFPNLD